MMLDRRGLDYAVPDSKPKASTRQLMEWGTGFAICLAVGFVLETSAVVTLAFGPPFPGLAGRQPTAIIALAGLPFLIQAAHLLRKIVRG